MYTDPFDPPFLWNVPVTTQSSISPADIFTATPSILSVLVVLPSPLTVIYRSCASECVMEKTRQLTFFGFTVTFDGSPFIPMIFTGVERTISLSARFGSEYVPSARYTMPPFSPSSETACEIVAKALDGVSPAFESDPVGDTYTAVSSTSRVTA